MTDKQRPPDWPGPGDLEKPSLKKLMEEGRKHGVGMAGSQAKVVPYTGVTGFMSPEDVKAVCADAYTISGFDTPIYGGRKLAVGVLASWKTLIGEPAGQPGRYPKIEDVRAIIDAAAEPYGHYSPALGQKPSDGTTFDLKARCLRMIHYNSKEPNLFAQIDRLCEIAGPNLDGFQLNMVWPREDEIRSLAQDYPTLRFILQINSRMYASVSRSPQLLATEIAKKYSPWVTDVLFDMSGGTGQPADLADAERALEALYMTLGGADGGGTNIGVAGGLDWHSVVGLKRLFDRWPDLSIDAEGRLRDKADALNCEMAREYVRRAAGVMPHRPSETRTAP